MFYVVQSTPLDEAAAEAMAEELLDTADRDDDAIAIAVKGGYRDEIGIVIPPIPGGYVDVETAAAAGFGCRIDSG